MHDSTAKVFIAMCPQGVASFDSCTWRGGVSDKHLTVNSGFLMKLLPGDIVFADQGLYIEEDCFQNAGIFTDTSIYMWIYMCSCLHNILRELANWKKCI